MAAGRSCPLTMFLVISKGTIEIKEGIPSLKDMQNLVGIPGQPAYIEVVSREFTDPAIDLVCDDEFLYKGCQATCITPRKRHVLHGQVLAVASNEEGETIGLTQPQIKLVKQQLILV